MADDDPRTPRTADARNKNKAADFLVGGGELGALIRGHDWENSPLGAPESWPHSLKNAVDLILPAAAQIVLFWGPDFIALYNDAYAPTIGEKHPRALGRPARENWAELWDDLEPLLQSVRDTGETVFAKDRPFYIERHGYPETVYFDISYSPVLDENGGVGGVLCIVSETTERVLSDEALRESEERLRLAVDNAEIGFWDVEEGHGQLTWPPRTKAMFGISPDVPVTMDDFYAGLHPDDLPRVAEAYAAAADPARRALYDVEYRTIGKEDGVLRWVAAKGRGIFDGDGSAARCLRVIGTAIDVTARKDAEQALRYSEGQLRALVNASSDIIYRMSPDWVEMRQLDGRDFLANTDAPSVRWMDEYIFPEDQQQIQQAIDEAVLTRGPFELEHRVRRADGSAGWIFSRAVPVTNADGNIVDWFGLAADITERKETEEAVRAEGHNLEILNRTGAAIASELDLERVVQLVTDAGVELTGAQFGAFFYNVVDEAGESYTLYTLSGVDRSAFEKFPMPRNTHVFGPTFRGEGVVRSDDITKDPRYGKNAPYYGKPKGHLPVVSYLAVSVMSRTGEVIGGLFFGHPESARFKERHERLMEGIAAQAAIAIDNAQLYRAAQHEIEQRVKAEQALTALNETLESRVAEEIARRSQAEEVLRQSQKMETVGQLSGGIAHDFNNLLQVIHGNLSLIARELPESLSKLGRAAAHALAGTERAAALTKRLLAFSRRQPLDPRPIDVNRLISDMSEMLHRTLGETVVIEIGNGTQVPPALVDGNQLENAILNLAINARDAMPKGGLLEITTSVADVDEGNLDRHPDAMPGNYVCISVRDHGDGMSADVLERAIEPFFSTKEVGQGTGLGLSTVYGFVRQSGGHLSLQSREGEGTCVELYLPRADWPAEKPGQKKANDGLATGRGEKVLLCEDDEGVRLFSSETLRDLGYEVVEAADAKSALSALMEAGRIDLLFTDVVLPGGQTGADLAREARKVQPDLKVLFTTGYARSALDRQHAGDKPIELLLKPFGIDELAEKVREMLN